MKRVYLFFLLLLCACAPDTKQCSLPQDLQHNGEPIHPTIVVATQFGDSSRLEPKPVAHVDGWTSKIDDELMYDDATRTAVYEMTYPLCMGEYTEVMHDDYTYIGQYNDVHIVLCTTYDTSGTGRFAVLGLVKRVGDTLVNAGDIAAGDRGHGGLITVLSLDNNILRYSQSATIDTIIAELKHHDIGIYFPPMVSGISLVYEVDLNKKVPVAECCATYTSTPVGIIFDEAAYDFSDYPYFAQEETSLHRLELIEHQFYAVAHTYVIQGKKELSLDDAHNFVSEVIAALQG